VAGLERVLEQADAEQSSPALEIEAMAPDEDLPGIAPDLDEPEPPADDEATIDVRVLPALRREYDLDALEDFDDLPPPGTRPHIMTIQPRPADTNPGPMSELEMPGIDLDGIDENAAARSTLRRQPDRAAAAPARGRGGRRRGHPRL
jgi:hypothetical protein